MSKTILLVPVTTKTQAAKIGRSLFKFCREQHIKTNFLRLAAKLGLEKIEQMLAQGKRDDLLENIVALQDSATKNKELVLVEGIDCAANLPYAAELNLAIAQALDAKIILVSVPAEQQIMIAADHYGERVLGYILSKADANTDFKIVGLQCIAKNSDFNGDYFKNLISESWATHLSAARFTYNLIKNAQAAQKTIALPEGNEPRTIKAAAICAQKNIAQCILFGDPEEIRQVARSEGVELTSVTKILKPTAEMIERYVAPLVELRKSKGLTPEDARKNLQDNMTLATMMAQMQEIDGVVSGAVHTTANTIRPALQIIKTIPGMSLVSAIFFMCLPEQVLVFGDCAVNPNPTAQDLAQIAIQSAESAKIFGIEPRVAMISYSTGESASGVDVDRVREATNIVKQQRPDILIEGPIQYDAALVPDVAALKMPNSPVAGKATICIFPELNTGNALYKAVQRSANILCIGPMLQGLNKPVNDLSRGCLVEDIVFTVALTAVTANF